MAFDSMRSLTAAARCSSSVTRTSSPFAWVRSTVTPLKSYRCPTSRRTWSSALRSSCSSKSLTTSNDTSPAIDGSVLRAPSAGVRPAGGGWSARVARRRFASGSVKTWADPSRPSGREVASMPWTANRSIGKRLSRRHRTRERPRAAPRRSGSSRPPPITRTTSPGRVPAARQPVAGRLDRPGAPRPRMSGRRAATASARPAAEAIVVSGSRPAQMSAIATASASASTSANAVEQRRRAVVRQRLVDGPDAPSRLALADGRERRPDRGRVVAVVVVDDDAADLALPLEAPADALERGQPGHDAVRRRRPAGRRRGDAQRVGDVVAAGGRQPDRQRPRRSSRPAISIVVPAGSAATIRRAGRAPARPSSRTARRCRG